MTTRVVATDAHEGPVFVENENALYFTSVPHKNGGPPVVAIKRLDLDSGRISVIRAEANVANGMTLEPSGCLLVCEQGTMSRAARISRFDCELGHLDTVVAEFEGKPLNSPNDIVVKSDATIWFTDPSYGWLQGFRPEPQLPDAVYRFDPATGEMDRVGSSFDHPNGLAFSPDESVLYVGDSGDPLRRTEGAQVASARVAVDKARTASIFIRPSRELEEQASSGRLGALALHGASALTGGIPLKVDGQVVGAIGTSGETPDEDEAISIAGAAADFSTAAERVLTFEGARIAGEAVARECEARGVAPVAAIVDTNGELIYVYRPDAAQVASVGVATDKARTAAIYRRESRDFEEQVAGGRRPSALHLARAVPLQGGIPITAAGEVVGAVGVSGATSADEDRELAQLGVAAAEAAATSTNGHASYFPGDAVRDKFETGGLLLNKPRYKIDAGRRTGPGEVELHEHEVDVMHVLQGRATVVAGEDTHELHEGDVLEIPAGVAHQFTDASDPFLYFVVKVAS